jgi:hypothetical protein
MKTLKNIFTILLIIFFTTVVACKNEKAAKQEKLVKKIEYINKENDGLEMTEFHDKNGNMIKFINHSEEYGDSETTYFYDNLKRLIEEKEFDTNGELKETKFHEYKSESDQVFYELTYEQRKGKEKKLTAEEKLEYDDNGNLFKKTHRAIYGIWIHNYKYYPNNKLKEEITIASKDTEKIITTHNEQGKRKLQKIYRRKTTDDEYELKQTNQWFYN